MPPVHERPVRLLALDLDGTVFGDDLVISERVRRAILLAQRAGVVVTIVTGRMFRPARAIAEDLEVDAPIICYQGAMVRDPASGRLFLHTTVPLPLAHEVIAEARGRRLHLNVYLDDEIYADEINEHALFYSSINMGEPIHPVGDAGAWLARQGGREPTKLVIITHAAQTDATLASFTSLFGTRLQVTKSHARFTEFTHRDCSKGKALALLAARLGIEREEVMAIGDGHNDLDMIAWAGWGVAMQTAPSDVQAAARFVCPPEVEDGVAQCIERYILHESSDIE